MRFYYMFEHLEDIVGDVSICEIGCCIDANNEEMLRVFTGARMCELPPPPEKLIPHNSKRYFILSKKTK